MDDQILTSLNPRDGQPQSGSLFGIATIWKTEGVPARVNEPFTEWHGKPIGITDPTGAICRVIHFPAPGAQTDELNIMHRTQSVDFGVIIDGQIELHLDNGVKTTLKKGAIVVQRGNNHVSLPGDRASTPVLTCDQQWVNTSKDYCVMAFILIPADKVVVEKSGEVLAPTEYPSY